MAVEQEQENGKRSRRKQLQIPTRLEGVETRRNKDPDFHASTSGTSGTRITSVSSIRQFLCFINRCFGNCASVVDWG